MISYKRHLAKTLTYRILGTILTGIISYIMTDNIIISSGIATVEFVLKPIVYFLHERIWYKFSNYGVSNKK